MAKWVYKVAKGERSVPDEPLSDPVFELPDVFRVMDISSVPLWETEPKADQYFLSYITPAEK